LLSDKQFFLQLRVGQRLEVDATATDVELEEDSARDYDTID